MKTINFVQTNRYQDSVTLMQVAAALRNLEGVEDAALMMGTAPNKQMLSEAGLLTPDGQPAGPNDLIIALRAANPALETARTQADTLLRSQTSASSGKATSSLIPQSLAGGLTAFPDANLVLISTPGIYAAVEAQKALASSRHVMIFSDNVTLEDEINLKQNANRRGLLLLGPDCGTAIIGGVPLGFANAVRRGPIGVVGASGTGMQEITSLIDRFGGGISHAIGTGSRDLSAQVGALATLAALAALQNDPSTRVIVIVSKPPDPTIASRVLHAAAASSKPTVVCFLGLDRALQSAAASNITYAATLEDAAIQAVKAISGGIAPLPDTAGNISITSSRSSLLPSQKYVRGLFSGGTFCYEGMLLLEPSLGPVYSNTPLRSSQKVEIKNPKSRIEGRHLCLDLGSDEFTVGRPHPMIDMSLRADRIILEAADPETAVVLLDVVLGYGAHPDPAGALAPAIRKAKQLAHDKGRELPIVAYICGTDHDPQNYREQKEILQEAGAILVGSNAAMSRWAAALLSPN